MTGQTLRYNRTFSFANEPTSARSKMPGLRFKFPCVLTVPTSKTYLVVIIFVYSVTSEVLFNYSSKFKLYFINAYKEINLH